MSEEITLADIQNGTFSPEVKQIYMRLLRQHVEGEELVAAINLAIKNGDRHRHEAK